jgi:hypothetical protein
MRPTVMSLLCAGCLGSFPAAAQEAARQHEVEVLLSKASWNFFWEQTDQPVPSAGASKGAMDFFRRGGKFVGRTTHMIAGNCEFEVVVRDDGFIFEWCGGYRMPQSFVSLDRTDTNFPFKNIAAPRKVWFQPK